MSVLDLRDAYHTLPLAEESQKYCGLTPYYGSPTYVYLRMGMAMSCSPALWQQFVHMSRYALETPVPLADLIALSPGYRVPPDLATVPYAPWHTRFALLESATSD